mmetsp:Transcript_11244/g.43351  ORF Transcript_11244/g.43351 Transcript_11244/m.43351 type:complete len:410 (-) Transcript_11244:519-1748(-)
MEGPLGGQRLGGRRKGENADKVVVGHGVQEGDEGVLGCRHGAACHAARRVEHAHHASGLLLSLPRAQQDANDVVGGQREDRRRLWAQVGHQPVFRGEHLLVRREHPLHGEVGPRAVPEAQHLRLGGQHKVHKHARGLQQAGRCPLDQVERAQGVLHPEGPLRRRHEHERLFQGVGAQRAVLSVPAEHVGLVRRHSVKVARPTLPHLFQQRRVQGPHVADGLCNLMQGSPGGRAGDRRRGKLLAGGGVRDGVNHSGHRQPARRRVEREAVAHVELTPLAVLRPQGRPSDGGLRQRGKRLELNGRVRPPKRLSHGAPHGEAHGHSSAALAICGRAADDWREEVLLLDRLNRRRAENVRHQGRVKDRPSIRRSDLYAAALASVEGLCVEERDGIGEPALLGVGALDDDSHGR